MVWTVYGDEFSTAQMTDSTMSQVVIMPRNQQVNAIRVWLIIHNSSAITNLQMKIYNNDAEATDPTATSLLATSTNSFDKADLITDTYGVKSCYFEFANIALRKGDKYHFVLNCSGYTYSEASHIAWKKAWPDPAYTIGYTATAENLAVAPYEFKLIGAKL